MTVAWQWRYITVKNALENGVYSKHLSKYLFTVGRYAAKGFSVGSRGGIGRRKGLKIPRLHGRAGSIPAASTI